MRPDLLAQWETRFIEATGAFPPGRDVAAAAGNSTRRASALELWKWIADQKTAQIAHLQADNRLSQELQRVLRHYARVRPDRKAWEAVVQAMDAIVRAEKRAKGAKS